MKKTMRRTLAMVLAMLLALPTLAMAENDAEAFFPATEEIVVPGEDIPSEDVDEVIEEQDEAMLPGARISARVSASPAMTRRPGPWSNWKSKSPKRAGSALPCRIRRCMIL